MASGAPAGPAGTRDSPGAARTGPPSSKMTLRSLSEVENEVSGTSTSSLPSVVLSSGSRTLCLRETPSGLLGTSFWRHLPDGLAKQKRKHKTGRTERRHDERTDGTDRDGATERSGAEPRGTDGRRRPERSDGAERSGDTGNGRSDGAEQTLLERTDGERVGARGRQPFQFLNSRE